MNTAKFGFAVAGLAIGLSAPGLFIVAPTGERAADRSRTVVEAPSDSARLQGTWSMISGAAGGYTLPSEYLNSMKRVFFGSEVIVTMGEQVFFRATIQLDTTHSPRTIDYHMTGGPTAGQVQLGIYAISGDTARFCFGAPSAERPADFTTIAGDGRTLSAWVRVRP